MVEDFNDNAPEFEQSRYEFMIRENEPAGTSVGTVLATDDDTGTNEEVRTAV